jgi:rSAM/selenodomain-associated transferase 2
MRSEISVIIPALNEANSLGASLEPLRASKAEIIVADGGSDDGTREIARQFGATVIRVETGRCDQMNEAAKLATGRILLFLHADTKLPEQWEDEALNTLKNPGVVCGAFSFRLDVDSRALRLIERLANFRSAFFRTPYGDQALFLTSEVFFRVGGYAKMPIMEDFDLVRRLRKIGKVVTSRAPAVTSARRWLELGPLKTTLINQAVILGYYMGVSPAKLAAFYRNAARKR